MEVSETRIDMFIVIFCLILKEFLRLGCSFKILLFDFLQQCRSFLIIETDQMGNQSHQKSPSLQISHINHDLNKATGRSQNGMMLHSGHYSKKSKKCDFVYLPPKTCEDEQVNMKGSTIFNEDLQSIDIDEEVPHGDAGNDLEENKSTLKKLCMENQRENGKVVVQWNQFIKIRSKNYLEDYIHIKEIGRGSFGTVSKVCKKNGKLYRAAKIIKMSSVNKKKVNRDKLISEILIMMKTDHPNINKLYEVYEWKKQYILIMDLCEGGDLFNMIKKQKAFSERRVAEIMKQILAGVFYLHKNRIVHRDLKPQNLLYDKDSKLVKISDFGTGYQLTSTDSKMSQLVGSPLYIAPQVVSGCYTQKCDIWSCGVILYIMLCGVPPFTGNSQSDIFQKITTQPLSFDNPVWKKRSAQCKKLVESMLIKNPDNRITIGEALNSVWIQKAVLETEERNQITGQFINNLTRFYFQNKLKAVVYTYIASQLFSNKDKQRLMKCFKDIDSDGDGVIERSELLSVLKSYKGQNFSHDELEKILQLVDTNESGHIDFTQFLVAASHQEQLLRRQTLEHAFSYFDTDNSGYITVQQIKAFLDNTKQTDQQIKKIFQQVDVNGDGKIELNEFVELLLNNQKIGENDDEQ